MQVNGWRRLALVLSALWLAALVRTLALEATAHRSGLLMTHQLPKGAIFKGDTLTLPDGTTYQLPTLRLNGEPWEQNWQELPPAALTERHVKVGWVLGGLLVPFVLWLFVEVAVVVAAWVRLVSYPGRMGRPTVFWSVVPTFSYPPVLRTGSNTRPAEARRAPCTLGGLARYPAQTPNPSIEGTSTMQLRCIAAAPHVKC